MNVDALVLTTDLDTVAAEVNARLTAAKAPIFCRAGKKALRWFRVYQNSGGAGYGVSRGDVRWALREIGIVV